MNKKKRGKEKGGRLLEKKKKGEERGCYEIPRNVFDRSYTKNEVLPIKPLFSTIQSKSGTIWEREEELTQPSVQLSRIQSTSPGTH